jgi:serine/threonine protein kinase/Flp pilus assembly protein TadD
MRGSSTWDDTWDLFHAALEVDEAERERFLAEACRGDEALYYEVQAFLASFRQSGVLDRSPAASAIPASDFDDLTGRRVGSFLIQKRIGAGGMGVVYDAEQQQPVQRQVALKVIHPGTSPQAAARFALEKQALALMTHPHIARVFDAGFTDDGRPFIAMERVSGIPLSAFCDQQRLPLRARLELFLQVCGAIQHAHQKGIIHRDIKPSNILVNADEGPKVIDFGVAKALHPILGGDRHLTVNEILLGTLEYMSPEQLDRRADGDVDTRSDIYSLGVVLYELLAGVLPYDWTELRRQGLDGLRRLAQEREPPSPSRRVLALESDLSGRIAAARGITAPALVRQLAGDLDWIVLKALDRDRGRRYATASEFADDVRRHLANEPVAAGPPTATYRLRKFVRRHRTAAGAAALAVITLTAGAALFTRQSLEIRRAAALAHRERIRAERVSEIMADVFKASDPYDGRHEVTAREVLDRSSERIRRLDDEPQVKASVMHGVGAVYSQMAVYEPAETLMREALRIRRRLYGADHLEIADSLEALGSMQLRRGRLVEADRLLQQSVAMKLRLLPADDPRRIEGLQRLGVLRRSEGRYDEAEARLREALKLSRSGGPRTRPSTITIGEELGIMYVKKGDLARAEASFRDALALRRQEGADTPRTAQTMSNLAHVLNERGDLASAEIFLRQAQAILERHLRPDDERLATNLGVLGLCLHNQGKYAEAEPYYRRALAIWRARHGDTHPNGNLMINNLALLAHDQNRFAEAERLFREALALQRKVYKAGHPDLALPMNNIARVLHDQGRRAEAEALYREALAIRRAGLKSDSPAIAESLAWLGKLLTEKRQLKQAEALLSEAVAIRSRAFKGDDWRLAEARSLLGGCYVAQKRFAEAEPLLIEGYAILERKRGSSYRRTLQARERLVQLYDAWGKRELAARHRALLRQDGQS